MTSRRLLRLLLAQLAVAAVTAIALAADVNAATVGFAYLITILGIAVYTDLVTAIVSSLTATACYNFFFLPPVHTFTIEQPANWVALISFLVASVIASRLVVTARSEAADAEARRREVEALYALSVDLFSATNRPAALEAAAERALENAGASGGGLVLFGTDPSDQRVVLWRGPREPGVEDLIASVGKRRGALTIPEVGGRDIYLPLMTGEHIIGVLVVRTTAATPRALESAAALVALAVERERFLAESARVQAMKEGDALKTSLLRAVSHDLITPLTSIALQIERLRRIVIDGPASAVVENMAAEAERLRRRIENLLSMARLEARSVTPRPEPTPPADLFRAAREHLGVIGEMRAMDVRVADDCPDAFVDPSLALEILVNLIENAHQASPPGSVLELSASRHPADADRVRLEIADRGSGAPEISERARHGLGLEIARTLGSASGGEVTLAGRPGGGTIARIDFPAAHLPPMDEEVPA